MPSHFSAMWKLPRFQHFLLEVSALCVFVDFSQWQEDDPDFGFFASSFQSQVLSRPNPETSQLQKRSKPFGSLRAILPRLLSSFVFCVHYSSFKKQRVHSSDVARGDAENHMFCFRDDSYASTRAYPAENAVHLHGSDVARGICASLLAGDMTLPLLRVLLLDVMGGDVRFFGCWRSSLRAKLSENLL